MNNQDKDYGRLENLQMKINTLSQESKDPGFTQYLKTVQARLDGQVQMAMSLENEVNQNYRVYLHHLQMQSGIQPSPSIHSLQSEVQPTIVNPTPIVEQIPVVEQIPIAESKASEVIYQQPIVTKKKRNVEFTVGAGLFCILGVLFILASFIMLGITYMGGLFKGISLYVIALAVVLVSELVFRKRMEKFSLAMTGLGLVSMYAATMINCLYLHNFGNVVAIILTVLISVSAAIMARKKDSGIIKVISFIGCYLCFLPAGKFGTTAEFVTVTIILFLINVFTILLSVTKRAKAVHITHLVSNMIMSVSLVQIALTGSMDGRLILLFLLSNLLTLGLVYFVSWKRGQCSIGVMVNFLIAFSVESFQYAMVMASDIHPRAIEEFLIPSGWYHIMFGAYALILVCLFLLFIKNKYKWIFYYFLLFMAFFTYGIESFDDRNCIKAIAILAVFILSKLLSRVKSLKISELVVTGMTLLYAGLFYESKDIWAHVFVVAFLLSMVALNHYKTVYQYIITFASILYLLIAHDNFALMPSLFIGIMFILLFAFNSVKAWRDSKPLIYNLGAVSLLYIGCAYAPLVSSAMNNLIATILGTAVVVLMFTEKYGMYFNGKYLFLSIFWTYMAFLSGIKIALIISIILMVIAILSVVMGFVLGRKEVRIYGLGLSLLVSLKVLFFDFAYTPIQERMLLFLIIGVIILSISFIYILLEKKSANRGE